jgi:hypothetical protein
MIAGPFGGAERRGDDRCAVCLGSTRISASSCRWPTAAGSSRTTPRLDGLYPQNRAAAVLADEVGMDFVMSMGKFRGFGGETDHWGTAWSR